MDIAFYKLTEANAQFLKKKSSIDVTGFGASAKISDGTNGAGGLGNVSGKVETYSTTENNVGLNAAAEYSMPVGGVKSSYDHKTGKSRNQATMEEGMAAEVSLYFYTMSGGTPKPTDGLETTTKGSWDSSVAIPFLRNPFLSFKIDNSIDEKGVVTNKFGISLGFDIVKDKNAILGYKLREKSPSSSVKTTPINIKSQVKFTSSTTQIGN
jgi:hypothetical protein